MLKLFATIIFFIFSGLLTSELHSQQCIDTTQVLVKFSEPMSRDGIFDTKNYILYKDNEIPLAIYKVGVVAGDTAVVLYTEKHNPQSSYWLIINNLKDKSGNAISESHRVAFY